MSFWDKLKTGLTIIALPTTIPFAVGGWIGGKISGVLSGTVDSDITTPTFVEIIKAPIDSAKEKIEELSAQFTESKDTIKLMLYALMALSIVVILGYALRPLAKLVRG